MIRSSEREMVIEKNMQLKYVSKCREAGHQIIQKSCFLSPMVTENLTSDPKECRLADIQGFECYTALLRSESL